MLEQEVNKPKNVSATLSRLLAYFKPYWLILIAVLGLLMLNAWTQVVTPGLTGQAFDCFITPSLTSDMATAVATDAAAQGAAPGAAPAGAPAGAPGAPGADGQRPPTAAQSNCTWRELPPGSARADYLRGLGALALWLVVIAVLGAFSAGVMFYLMAWTGQHVLRRIQTQLFAHLTRQSIGYHTRVETGDLMSRITNDVSTIQQAMSFALVQVLSGTIIISWVAWSMLRANWAYALVSLAVVPFMVIATVWFSNQARKAFRKTRTEIGNVNAELEEGISGVREVQAFSREDANISSFQEANAKNRDANIRAVAFTSALSPTLEALGYVALGIVAGIGGFALLRGTSIGGSVVSIGLIVAFVGYVQRFNGPIAQISILWTNIQSAIAGAERIFELLDVQPDIVERLDAIEMPTINGRVTLKGVDAEYVKGEPVLRDVTLTAEPGQTVAIVGPTGAGKTTLVNLLPRFYDVTGGAVEIDGVDVRNVTLPSLRRQIGIVLQDSFLFSDTVANNIRYGRPDASDDEVKAAARLARADDFISRLPDGYDTILGERGGGLSQGQRQLLSIARAALADPRILILDEATSSVDTRTERQIQAALETLLAGRTSFVIAHRLSTIRKADQVLVLVKGEIVERGTHEELLALKGVYYDLYMSQFRRQEAVEARSTGPAAPSTALPAPSPA
jgi:ATP-binding cassette subfamily B protein